MYFARDRFRNAQEVVATCTSIDPRFNYGELADEILRWLGVAFGHDCRRRHKQLAEPSHALLLSAVAAAAWAQGRAVRGVVLQARMVLLA